MLVEKRTDDRTLLAAVPIYNEQLEAHYNIERGAFTKALGRRTQVILVQPRDQFRYGYRLWLDDETAMPLKSQLCDRNGKVIEQILFAELNFRERIPADASSRRSRQGFSLGAAGRAGAAHGERAARLGRNPPAGGLPPDHLAAADHRGLERAGAAPGVFGRARVGVGVHRAALVAAEADARVWPRWARHSPSRARWTAIRSPL